MTDYWREQRSERVTDEHRPGFSVAAVDADSPGGGFLYARNRFLMTDGARTVLELADPPPPDNPDFPDPLVAQDYVEVTADGSPWIALDLHEYEYRGPLDLPRHVAELQCRAKALARSRPVTAQPFVSEGMCEVALHYVVTGEVGWIPKGNPDTPPEHIAPIAALTWGQGDPEIAIVDTGLDIYSSATGAGAQGDATEPTPPGGSVLYVDKDRDIDLLHATLPDGSQTPYLAAQAGHGTFVTYVAERAAGGKSRIVNARALDPDGVGTEELLVDALTRALGKYPDLAVISMSLGGYSDPTDYHALDPRFVDASPPNSLPLGIGTWLMNNSDLGAHQPVFVAAAGNYGTTDREFWPAADPRVVAVASAAAGGGKSSFSNSGPWVDFCSLGEGVVADYPTGDFLVTSGAPVHLEGGARWSGTSFATPLVAGEIVRRRAAAAPVGGQQPSPTMARDDFATDLAQELAATGIESPAGCGLLWDPRGPGRMGDPSVPPGEGQVP